MYLSCLRGDFPRPWRIELRPGLTVIHDRSDGGGSTIRSALNDLVLPDGRVHDADVTGVDGTLIVGGREVPLGELLSRVPGLIPVRMPRASALQPAPPAPDQVLDAAIENGREAVRSAEDAARRAEREWQAGRIRWAESVRVAWEDRVVAARSMGAARARLAMADPVAGPVLERGNGTGPGPDAELQRLARELVHAARAACEAAEAALAEAEQAFGVSGSVGPRHTAGADVIPALDAADLSAIERLVDTLETVEAHPGIDAVEAAQVAVEWERIRALSGDDIDERGGDAARLRAAQEAVARARRDLYDASQGSVFDRADVEQLEATHAEILAAWESVGPAGDRQRLDDARQAEQAVLDRMGLASYAEYMAASPDDGGALGPGVDAARRRLVAAEEALADVETDLRAAAEGPAAAFTATLGALHARASELLGEPPGDDVAAVLRERIASDPFPDLLVAMAAVGIPVGRPATRDQVICRARRWLDHVDVEGQSPEWPGDVAEPGGRLDGPPDDTNGVGAPNGDRGSGTHDVDDRIGRERAAVARARADLAEAEAARTALVSRRALAPRRATRDDAPDPGRLDLESRAARVTFEATRIAPERVVEVGDSDRVRGRAEARVTMVRTELAALEELKAIRDTPQPRVSSQGLDEVVWRFLAVLGAGVDDFPVSGAGPAPVVLREPFGSLSPSDAVRLCEALMGPSLAVQIVLITARCEVVTWADRRDSDAVSLVSTIWSASPESAEELSPGREQTADWVPTIDGADDEEGL